MPRLGVLVKFYVPLQSKIIEKFRTTLLVVFDFE